MEEPQESSDFEVEVELVDFSKPVEKPLVGFDYGNYLTSNLSPRGYAKGLKTYTCSCGAHSFAAAWDDKIDNWVRHQRMTPALRQHVEEKLGVPEKPPPAHVILIDVDDEHLLREHRWRTLKSQKGHRCKFYLMKGRRSKTLQRTMFPKAGCVEFLNGWGADVRRCNLRCTTLKVLLRERNARRGWQNELGAGEGMERQGARKEAGGEESRAREDCSDFRPGVEDDCGVALQRGDDNNEGRCDGTPAFSCVLEN